jgi:hypothetical protein
MKKLILAGMILLLTWSCNETTNKNQSKVATLAPDEPTLVTVGNFLAKAPELVGKPVTIKGTADHICKGDGKKLFIISTEEEGRVKVVTGENMAAFNSENEGLDFVVNGLVDEVVVDEAYLLEWEEEIKAGIEENKHLGGGAPMTEEEKAAGKHAEEDPGMEQINGYRQEMAEKGVNKLSFFSIVCTSYTVEKE